MMEQKTIKRVVVVDDHSLFLDGITSLLESAGYTIAGQAVDGRSALEIIRETQPDLVLLDIKMPHMDGRQVLKSVKEEFPMIKVVMLTVSENDDDFFDAIKSGADGYLLKDLNAKEFFEMLKGLEQGIAAINRKMTTRLMNEFQQISSQGDQNQNCLTKRELELITLMVNGLSNKAIAERLFISENTVKYHIRNILQKLGVQNRTEAAALALREGIIDNS